MSAPYRILITGSRDWADASIVRKALADVTDALSVTRKLVIVHGACRTGADQIAHDWARGHQFLGVTEEAHPANWAVNGRRAGPIRNAYMVSLGADIALAFIKDGSRGASHTAALAEAAGIPTRRYTA